MEENRRFTMRPIVGGQLKTGCTKAQVRTIARDRKEPLQEKMREKLRSEEDKKIYQMRSYTVEPVFWEYEMEQTVVNNEHVREEKNESRISSDMFGSQHWEDSQQNTGNSGTG